MARMCGIPSNDPGITHVMELPWRFLRTVNYCESPLYIAAIAYDTDVSFLSTRYLQCFKTRQPGEHLVVHLSQPVLGQKPAKGRLRHLAAKRGETRQNEKRKSRSQREAASLRVTICRCFSRVDKYHLSSHSRGHTIAAAKSKRKRGMRLTVVNTVTRNAIAFRKVPTFGRVLT